MKLRTVVEREHVVLAGLDVSQVDELLDLVGMLSARSCASERSWSVWKSCQMSFSNLPVPIIGPRSATTFQPSLQSPRVPIIS
jgi:hypothetical protein